MIFHASGTANAISAIPTTICIQPSSGEPTRGTCRTSHSSPNHSASQNTAPATPVGNLRSRSQGVCPAVSGTAANALLLRCFTLLCKVFLLLLARNAQRIPSRREVRPSQQQQPRQERPDH